MAEDGGEHGLLGLVDDFVEECGCKGCKEVNG